MRFNKTIGGYAIILPSPVGGEYYAGRVYREGHRWFARAPGYKTRYAGKSRRAAAISLISARGL